MKKLIGIGGLLIFLSIGLSCKKEDVTEGTLEKAVNWIWSQQSEDGGWHSKTHAVLRDGKVLTPYILFHLLQLPYDLIRGRDKEIENAYAFITREMHAAMNEDKTNLADYPNYSAAYTLRVINIAQRDTQLQRIIINYLFEQQFIEQRGFDSTHLAYGGWGYGEPNLKPGEHGHVDISHTRRGTEALCEVGYLRHEDFRSKIRYGVEIFLHGVQRNTNDLRNYEGCKSRSSLPYDGGFIASVVTLSTIKSQAVEIPNAGHHYPSYATATCDGLMTMRMLGMQKTKAYADAKKWLKENQHYHTIDGLTDHPEQWDQIMHYYHLAVRSEAMNAADPYGPWRDSIELILEKEIQPGGYYVNPLGGVNKEDDPLMATIFAIQALGNIRNHKEVVTSPDIKIIDSFIDTTMNPAPFTGLHKTKIIIKNLTNDTLFFSNYLDTKAFYHFGLRNSSIGGFYKPMYDLPLYPMEVDTFISYREEFNHPYFRWDVSIDYLINHERRTAQTIFYN